ncbi:MAG: hypothetical protein ACREHG_02085 [Candidatus Saccharimonadales bacterium]
MSSNFLVYTESEDVPDVVTPDLALALSVFCEAVTNGESAELKWSA